jgi:hypothetical protein
VSKAAFPTRAGQDDPRSECRCAERRQETRGAYITPLFLVVAVTITDPTPSPVLRSERVLTRVG